MIGRKTTVKMNYNEYRGCFDQRKRYNDYTLPKNGACYQLIDPFVLFSLRFLNHRSQNSWMEYIHTPSYVAWRGNAFEICCLNLI